MMTLLAFMGEISPQADRAIVFALMKAKFLGKSYDHSQGPSWGPFSWLPDLTADKALITVSPPAWTNYPGILSTSGDFPIHSCFKLFLQDSVVLCWFNIRHHRVRPSTMWLYSSVQYPGPGCIKPTLKCPLK